jgi:hypothetical protein
MRGLGGNIAPIYACCQNWRYDVKLDVVRLNLLVAHLLEGCQLLFELVQTLVDRVGAGS